MAARAFGIWTLLSCTLTLLCAAHITCKPLYHATLASFAIALLFFSIEFWVYETVSTKTILAPSIIACTCPLPLNLTAFLTTHGWGLRVSMC